MKKNRLSIYTKLIILAAMFITISSCAFFLPDGKITIRVTNNYGSSVDIYYGVHGGFATEILDNLAQGASATFIVPNSGFYDLEATPHNVLGIIDEKENEYWSDLVTGDDYSYTLTSLGFN